MKQMHAGDSTNQKTIEHYGEKSVMSKLWHGDTTRSDDEQVRYWSGQAHARLPKELLNECLSTARDLIENHPDILDDIQDTRAAIGISMLLAGKVSRELMFREFHSGAGAVSGRLVVSALPSDAIASQGNTSENDAENVSGTVTKDLQETEEKTLEKSLGWVQKGIMTTEEAREYMGLGTKEIADALGIKKS